LDRDRPRLNLLASTSKTPRLCTNPRNRSRRAFTNTAPVHKSVKPAFENTAPAHKSARPVSKSLQKHRACAHIRKTGLRKHGARFRSLCALEFTARACLSFLRRHGAASTKAFDPTVLRSCALEITARACLSFLRRHGAASTQAFEPTVLRSCALEITARACLSFLRRHCAASTQAFESTVLRSDLLISPSEAQHCFDLCFVRLHRRRKAPYANLVTHNCGGPRRRNRQNRDIEKYANRRNMHIKCVHRDFGDSSYVAPHLWLASPGAT
jgi:hypothetical protein